MEDNSSAKSNNIKKPFWDKFTSQFDTSSPKVDNEKIERLMKGGFLFGFTVSDLLIILSAFLTLVFLQLKPYLIPYLEGTLGKGNQYQSEITLVLPEEELLKPTEEIGTPSSEVIIDPVIGTPSAESDQDIKLEEKILCPTSKPELCTLECMINPPYLCGSDGKSYCSECQACANGVEWFAYQNLPCDELVDR